MDWMTVKGFLLAVVLVAIGYLGASLAESCFADRGQPGRLERHTGAESVHE